MKSTKNPQAKPEDHHLDQTIEDLERHLGDITSVESYKRIFTRDFVTIFLEIFVSNTPYYELGQDRFGANRSNWTYHTAFAIKKTCEILTLNCKFETEGRLDAVVEAFDEIEETPVALLFAEWEWNHSDIFGNGKELEKLWGGTHELTLANALMFTYCPVDDYPDFLKQVVQYWQQQIGEMRNYPRLFLVTVLYGGTSYREFRFVRTVEVDAEKIRLWDDSEFR